MADLFLPDFEAWTDGRTRLKHNWFERLADLVRHGEGAAPRSLLEWPEKAPKLRQWLDETENALSPRQVIDLVHLSGPADEVLAELRARLAGIELAQEGITDLESLFRYLAEMNANPRHYALKLALARGLDYYAGPVFEATVEEPKIGSLGGAGRDDGFIGMFLGEDIPATGASSTRSSCWTT